MERPFRVIGLAAVSFICLDGVAWAQTANRPDPGDVAQQFKSGAGRIGSGAEQLGVGIKQGAILTWQAVEDGATAVAARFKNGDKAGQPGQSNP
ncbi:MAG: hypothetical protein POH28_07610 [Acidocella sp.]|nr:hypothetical protein [Acidocella sp.]